MLQINLDILIIVHKNALISIKTSFQGMIFSSWFEGKIFYIKLREGMQAGK